ncbi:AzlC family ABC transporter permease [Megalodesulfovibrio paquesii]
MHASVVAGSAWAGVGEGFRAIAPVLLGVLPFGVTFAVLAGAAGADPWGIMASSALAFAGASQLVVVDLLNSGASMILALVAGLTVNLRLVMYSASLAPEFARAPMWHRVLVGFFMTDQSYAISLMRFSRDSRLHRMGFTMGASVLLYVVWLLGNALGIALGAVIPKSLSLDFAVPVTFMALIAPTLRDRPAKIAALVAGVSALLLDWMPKGLGLMAGAGIGIVAGMVAESRHMKSSHRKGR